MPLMRCVSTKDYKCGYNQKSFSPVYFYPLLREESKDKSAFLPGGPLLVNVLITFFCTETNCNVGYAGVSLEKLH